MDTGFIVFNHASYPHLTRLLSEHDVPAVMSDVSLGAPFAQRSLLRPAFPGMLRDRPAPGGRAMTEANYTGALRLPVAIAVFPPGCACVCRRGLRSR
ncbi:hypothetical protein [Sinisalibacter aestuarii]|uniref:Uncharacterized protein n=1 Tax=Sinisalibacter aestuarii TaxID=2949426 RepID=A0ABQ5LXY9_9RHOB|nr:hypothetical protein [Sinisalibacter aestuarii]GKY89126.1 hypothetical protein STA1M1_29950 [Sinisalibacter aestuarii]